MCFIFNLFKKCSQFSKDSNDFKQNSIEIMSNLNDNNNYLKLQISTDDDSSLQSPSLSETPSDSSACNSNRGSFNSSLPVHDLKFNSNTKNINNSKGILLK
jgi:hypothetical protein